MLELSSILKLLNLPSLLVTSLFLFSFPLLSSPCMNDLAGFPNPVCTANDVTTATLAVFSGPPLCVNQTTIYVQLQAQSIAGSNIRYDIGYFISLDGGNAKTGTCYIDYLPPPLSTTATPPATIRTSPYWNSDLDTCGDIEQDVTNYRNIGGTTVLSGTQGPPTILAIPCRDSNADNFSDISVCTTWDNQQSIDCATNLDTIPGTASKCRCEPLKIGNITYKPVCESDSDCNDNSACTLDSCNINTGLCQNVPAGLGTPCDDGNLCTENDSCGGLNNLVCTGTTVVCGNSPCQLPGTCDFSSGCPKVPNGNECDDGQLCTSMDMCLNGTCVGTNSCPNGQTCLSDICVECIDASQCDDANICTDNTCVSNMCVFINNMSSCDDSNLCTENDICSNGSCEGTPLACNTPGICEISGGSCLNGICSYANAPDGTTCGSNLQCFNGACLAASGCASNNDCNDNDACTIDTCTANVCTNMPITCASPGVCQANPGICINGVCNYPNAPEGSSCGVDPRLSCISGHCWATCGCIP